MAEIPAEVTAETPAPAERGTLEVRDRVLEHLAEAASLETPGTVVRRGALRGLVGSGAPHASVHADRTGARLHLDVAALWPCDVARVAAEVRDHVIERTATLSGTPVQRVDVTVAVVGPDADTATRNRRRVQ